VCISCNSKKCFYELLFLLLLVFTVSTSVRDEMPPKPLQILFKQYSAKVY